MNLKRFKFLLITCLSASLLVGCAELPTSNSNTPQVKTPGAEKTPVKAQDVQVMLGEIKQLLASVSALKGASQEFSAAASAYRVSAYATAQTSNPWTWTITSSVDGVEEATRHVIETNAAGEVVTDIRSTRRITRSGNDATLLQEDVVEKSPRMRLGTYKVEGTRKQTGIGTPEYKLDRNQITTFTPLGGGPATVVTVTGNSEAETSLISASGTLPDGSTVTYESRKVDTRQSTSQTDSTTDIDYGYTMTLVSPEQKTFKLECKSRSLIASTTGKSTSEGKSAIVVSLGSSMKVRFNADMLSTSKMVPTGNGGYSSEFSWDRFNLTAELLDGEGARIAPIALGLKEGSYEMPKTGTVSLEGQEPAELDMTPIASLMNIEVSLLPSI